MEQNAWEESGTEQKRERGLYYFELLLFVILGFLLGIVVKTEAAKRITIGFDDYRVAPKSQGYDFNALEQELAKQQKDQGSGGSAAAAPGGSCQQQ